MENRNLKRTAIHEAGHAVISNHFGEQLVSITIIDDEEEEEDCNYLGAFGREPLDIFKIRNGEVIQPSPDEVISLCLNLIAVPLGGLAAENIYDKAPGRLKGVHGIVEDLERAESGIQRLSHCLTGRGISPTANKKLPPKNTLEGHLNNVTEILIKKWAAVEALAFALIQTNTVSGDEAKKIIESGCASLPTAEGLNLNDF